MNADQKFEDQNLNRMNTTLETEVTSVFELISDLRVSAKSVAQKQNPKSEFPNPKSEVVAQS